MYKGAETFFFQATINLLIGYEPPGNIGPNLSDHPDGNMSHVDVGKLTLNLIKLKVQWKF